MDNMAFIKMEEYMELLDIAEKYKKLEEEGNKFIEFMTFRDRGMIRDYNIWKETHNK